MPELSAAFWDYDRTTPIARGRVRIEGFDLRCTILRPEESFARASGAEFDVTELSFSNTLTAVSKAAFPYWLIPVFPSRAFRHSAVFVRTDRNISSPLDLKGKTLGVAEYDMTAALVVRGFLRDQYGIQPSDIRWMIGDKERTKDISFPVGAPPAGVDMTLLPPGRSLEERLLVGEFDAIISLHSLTSNVGAETVVRRLFSNPMEVEQSYFRDTGIFPIMHAVGVRKSLVAKHPELPQQLFAAFVEAKRIAVNELEIIQAPKVTLPWAAETLRQTRGVLGDDFWPYGLAANLTTLRAQMRWSWEDGLQARRVELHELFADSVKNT